MFTASRKAQTFHMAAMLSLGTAACVTAQGGYGAHRDNGSYRNNGDYGDVGRGAYDNGYREGIDHGQNDARRGPDHSHPPARGNPDPHQWFPPRHGRHRK